MSRRRYSAVQRQNQQAGVLLLAVFFTPFMAFAVVKMAYHIVFDQAWELLFPFPFLLFIGVPWVWMMWKAGLGYLDKPSKPKD